MDNNEEIIGNARIKCYENDETENIDTGEKSILIAKSGIIGIREVGIYNSLGQKKLIIDSNGIYPVSNNSLQLGKNTAKFLIIETKTVNTEKVITRSIRFNSITNLNLSTDEIIIPGLNMDLTHGNILEIDAYDNPSPDPSMTKKIVIAPGIVNNINVFNISNVNDNYLGLKFDATVYTNLEKIIIKTEPYVDIIKYPIICTNIEQMAYSADFKGCMELEFEVKSVSIDGGYYYVIKNNADPSADVDFTLMITENFIYIGPRILPYVFS